MKILLFGGSGCLGSELKKINNEIICPSHSEIDISNLKSLEIYLEIIKPDVIINAAAITDNREAEKYPSRAIQTNIIGSANIAMLCRKIRLVYISTDYIYKGGKGNYKESDEILPFNFYSWTKLGGECSVRSVVNHLIIRTSFGKNTFDYPVSFIDKWSSKDYVDKIAPLIYEAALSPLTGVLNLGTERKTLYSHAKERNENVQPVKISETNFFTPYDTSLNLQKWFDYKDSKPIAKPHTKCRVCGNENLIKYLDLGLMPLANNLSFTSQEAKNKERYPLQILFCNTCSLSQLSVVIDPEKMFSYYTYRSSINKGYVIHCADMAVDLKQTLGLNKDSFIVDIAGNDGTLLRQFRHLLDCKVLNVDPASNLTAIAESEGIESLTEFWSMETAADIMHSHGKADLITATNVFAHVDNVKVFLAAAKLLLKDEGVLVLEFPYLVDFIEKKEFDTVYFEHLSYFSLAPLSFLCMELGLAIQGVDHFPIHGGSIRASIIKSEERIRYHDDVEGSYNDINKYLDWAKSIDATIAEFSSQILSLKKQGFKIAGFGASAKGNTLLNSSGMNTDMISWIADETPEKIGKFSPGTGIPIVNKHMITKDVPDYIIILSWNFKDEIIEKLKPIYNGKIIIPIPDFTVIQCV